MPYAFYDNPVRLRLLRIMKELGFDQDPYKHDDFTVTAVFKAVKAFEEWDSETYITRGGAERTKTGKRREQERAVLDAFCMLLADHPDQPLGSASGGVFMTIRDAIYAINAQLAEEARA